MFENINEVAVLVSAILAAAVGSIWYSPLLFGNMWMKSVGLTTHDDSMMAKRAIIMAVIQGVFAQIVFFFGIAQFTSYTFSEVIPMMHIGIILSILFCAQIFSTSIWERRSFAYVLINSGYMVTILFGGLAVISYWPW